MTAPDIQTSRNTRRFGRWGHALAIAATALAPAVTPVLAKAETLADALASAYRHSHLVEQYRALLRATDEDVAQAMTLLRPVLSFIGSSTYSYTGGSVDADSFSASLGLSARMTLFDNGRSQLAIEAAKETVLATRDALVSLEQRVLFATVEAYLDVLSAADTVSLRQNNVRVLTEQLRAARDRFEVGEVTRTDVALAEAALAQARAGEAAAQGALLIARESYRVAVGRYPGALAGVPAIPQLPNSQDAAEGLAVRTHPDIRQAQRQITIAGLQVAAAEAAMKFTVTGNAGASLFENGSGVTESFSIGVDVTQPILGSGQNGAGVLGSRLRAAKAQEDASRASLMNTVHNVRQQVGNAWANLQSAAAQVQATDRQIEAAQIAFDGVREEATLGARTTLDVLDAEQDLLDARTARVDAQANQYLAAYGLLSATGLLTAQHLGLPVQIYDPAAYYNAVKSAPLPKSKQGKQLDKLLERLGKN